MQAVFYEIWLSCCCVAMLLRSASHMHRAQNVLCSLKKSAMIAVGKWPVSLDIFVIVYTQFVGIQYPVPVSKVMLALSIGINSSAS